MNKHVVIIGGVILVSGIAGFFLQQKFLSQESAPVAVQTQKVTVRLAWLHQTQFAGMYVAQEKGFYKDAGLEVELKEYENELDAPAEIGAGKVDFSVLSSVEMLKAIGDGHKVKAVSVIYQDSPYAFASLKETKVKSPQDMKGKTLGIKGGNNQGKVTYSAILNAYGVDAEDVTMKDVDFEVDESEDLVQKRADVIDLYRTDQTYLLDKKGVKYDLFLPEAYKFGTYGDMIVSTTALIEENPEMIGKFVSATWAGWTYAKEHPEEALAISKKYANELYQ